MTLTLDAELAGLDALDTAPATRRTWARRLWAGTWPKLFALGAALLGWQVVVWSGWKPDYVLPGPTQVLPRLVEDLSAADTWRAVATTMRRAVTGFAMAIGIGLTIGVLVAQWRVVRSGIGMLITGLQTMPSITWFPLAMLLFQISEAAILFVVVLGAAPSVANGVIAGIDQVPPLFRRAGQTLGATGWRAYRYVVLPAALPSVVSGLKQGWAFAWRSLLAGELLVIVANQPSIGARMEMERQFSDAVGLMSGMILILLIGVIVDSAVFSTLDRALRRRRGLLTDES
ncbi:MAG: ABC transporter permease [Desertimonas sp.]